MYSTMMSKVICPLLRHQRTAAMFECNPLIYHQLFARWNSTKGALTGSRKSEVDTNAIPMGEKVKETTKTVSYMGVILLGVGVTGALFYGVFSELFSSKSPNNVYTKASKRCINDPRIQDSLGQPIKIYGEETRRGRRQHVNHLLYEKNGKKHLRMKFYLKGSFRKGTAQLEMVENDNGNYEYRYLFVEVDDLLRSTIIVEDNRNPEVYSQKNSLLY